MNTIPNHANATASSHVPLTQTMRGTSRIAGFWWFGKYISTPQEPLHHHLNNKSVKAEYYMGFLTHVVDLITAGANKAERNKTAIADADAAVEFAAAETHGAEMHGASSEIIWAAERRSRKASAYRSLIVAVAEKAPKKRNRKA